MIRKIDKEKDRVAQGQSSPLLMDWSRVRFPPRSYKWQEEFMLLVLD